MANATVIKVVKLKGPQTRYRALEGSTDRITLREFIARRDIEILEKNFQLQKSGRTFEQKFEAEFPYHQAKRKLELWEDQENLVKIGETKEAFYYLRAS